jgi:putative transposase
MLLSKDYPDYLTSTCLNWLPLLEDDKIKEIIINSLRFLVGDNRVTVYAFVIMRNHFHLIWQIIGNHSRESVQRDFLRFTSQQILKEFRNNNSSLLESVIVNAKDRTRQVWERDSLSVPLWTQYVLEQNLEYIHNNPVRAGICKHPEAYNIQALNFIYSMKRPGNF